MIGGLVAGGLAVVLFVAMLIAATNQARKTKAVGDANLQVAEKERVQADVRTITKAVYSGDGIGDLDTVLRFTHPKVIELMGGMARAKTELNGMLKIRPLGLSLESFEFPSDPTFIQTSGNQYVFVPSFSIIKSKDGQRVESLNFQMGARKVGTTEWKYVEGGQVTSANVKTFFPDFPTSQEGFRRNIARSFPEIRRGWRDVLAGDCDESRVHHSAGLQATLHACAIQPRGVKGSCASKIFTDGSGYRLRRGAVQILPGMASCRTSRSLG